MNIGARLLEQAAARIGADAVRLGTEADAVDGVQPDVVASPATADDVAVVVAWASRERLTVGVRGGGTKLTWGGVCAPTNLALAMHRLNRVVEHRHGDLTATVEAGATLSMVNQTLAQHGQWMPFDPPWADQATIGGLIATNDSGPHRHAHGAPRDSIIGITLVRTDGVQAKSGGIVVKNVAGYDLSRLLTGAFGSLGVIVDATFKLSPRAVASRTTTIEAETLEALDDVVAAVTTSTLTPSVVEIAWPPARLLVRFESVESAVEQQAAELSGLLSGSATSTILKGEAEQQFWLRYHDRWDQSGTIIKLSLLPRALVPTLEWLREAAAGAELRMTAQGRAGLGVVDVGLDGPVDAQARLVTQLRERLSSGSGSAVIRRAKADVRRAVDPWGPIGEGLPVMRAIKQRFDPNGILNPGKGPV